MFFIFRYVNNQNVLILNMASKVVYGFLSKVMSILSFKIQKFKITFPYGKREKIFMFKKGYLTLRKVNFSFYSKKYDLRPRNMKNT